MGRLIVLILLVVVALWLVRRALGPHTSRRDDSTGDGRNDSPSNVRSGELVRCAHCGMYLPDAEAKRTAGLPYCTEDHARLGPRKQ